MSIREARRTLAIRSSQLGDTPGARHARREQLGGDHIDAVEAEALTKSYGSARGIVDLDLTLPARTIFGFLGPNGAGKTTTVRVLLDFLRPTRGRALSMSVTRVAIVREGRLVKLAAHHTVIDFTSAPPDLDAMFLQFYETGRDHNGDARR